MGRNHNLYGGVRIGAPMTFNDTLLDVADSDNGLPIRDVATRFRRSSTFNPSVSWRYEDAGPYDVTSLARTSNSSNDLTTNTAEDVFMSSDGSTVFILVDMGTFARVEKASTPSAYSVASLSSSDFTNMGNLVLRNGATANDPKSMWFSRDGQYLFMADGQTAGTGGSNYSDDGATGFTTDSLNRYTAITPWVSYNTTADQHIGIRGTNVSIYFNPTGKHLFTNTQGQIDRYDLGVAYDLSTLTNPSINVNIGNSELDQMPASSLGSVFFSQDGYRMIAISNSNDNDRTRYYSLSTPFDPTTNSHLHSWTGGAPSSFSAMMTEDGAHLYGWVGAIGHKDILHWSIPSEGGAMGQDPVIGSMP